MSPERSGDHTAIDIAFDPHRQYMRGVAVHGNAEFSVPYISEVLDAENLFQGGCRNMLTLPRNIEHLVSLYPWEAYDVEHDLQSRLEYRMYDAAEVPDRDEVIRLAQWVNACRANGPTLVHCQAGLNRSGLISAVALILEGRTPELAIDMLRKSRSPAVLCNPTFERFVREFTP